MCGKVLSPGRPEEEEGMRPVDRKAQRARRAEGGTGGGVTRRPPGRNLRDLRVAEALPAARRAEGRGRGAAPGGSSSGAGPAAAWEPRRGRAGGGGGAEPGDQPRVHSVLPELLSKENVCRTSQ